LTLSIRNLSERRARSVVVGIAIRRRGEAVKFRAPNMENGFVLPLCDTPVFHFGTQAMDCFRIS
jgi:hypothetical protein